MFKALVGEFVLDWRLSGKAAQTERIPLLWTAEDCGIFIASLVQSQ